MLHQFQIEPCKEDLFNNLIASKNILNLEIEAIQLAKDMDHICDLFRNHELDFCSACKSPTFFHLVGNNCMLCGEDVGKGKNAIIQADSEELAVYEDIIALRFW